MATTAKQTSSNSSASSSVRSNSATVSQSHFQQNSSQLNISTAHHRSSASLSDSPINSTTNHIYHHQIYRSTSNNSQSEQAEQDIEIIAKQISDHAEAIYQSWKARGLPATEFLNCHSVNSDAFDKTLTPSVQRSTTRRSESPQYEPKIGLGELSKSSNCIDTVSTLPSASAKMSNSNLKKLVSTFVNEDKARQQQQQQQQSAIGTRKTNILTSGTIKDALRKFENIDNANTTNIRPNYLKNNRSTNNSSTVTGAPTTTLIAQREKSPKLQLDQTQRDQLHSQSSNNSFDTNKLNKNVPDVLINTIEQEKLIKPSTLINSNKDSLVSGSSASPKSTITTTTTTTTNSNSSSSVRKKPETPAKPTNLLNNQPAWSLKNRLKPIENGSTNNTTIVKVEKSNDSTTIATTTPTPATPSAITNYDNDIKSAKLVNKQNSKSSKVNKLMDEVLMEEERLINALKTGTVLNNDKLPEVITSTLSNTNSNAKSIANNTNSMTNAKLVATNADQQQPSNWNGAQKSITSDPTKTETTSNDVDGVPLKIGKLRPKNDAAVPHPDLSLHTNKSGTNAGGRQAGSVPAVRPFLTRGSVAERVLMFEKCPEIKALRNVPKDANKIPVILNFFKCFY